MGNDDDGLEDFYNDIEIRGRGARMPVDDDGYADDYDVDMDDEDREAGQSAPQIGGMLDPTRAKPIGIASPPPSADNDDDGPASAASSSNRVVPQAGAPKPSKRLIKEAQPSFLGANEDYELPPLQLLAEPKSLRQEPGPELGCA